MVNNNYGFAEIAKVSNDFNCHTGSSSTRVDNLKTVFSNPMSEVYLLLYQAALQIFAKRGSNHFNHAETIKQFSQEAV